MVTGKTRLVNNPSKCIESTSYLAIWDYVYLDHFPIRTVVKKYPGKVLKLSLWQFKQQVFDGFWGS